MTTNMSLMAKIDNEFEPSTYKEAYQDSNWISAMQVEMDSLLKNNTWELVPYPNHRNVIANKWIYRIKYNSNGEIEKYKARLVAKGFSQQYGLDYEETFAPVAKMPTIRLIMSISASMGWKLFQLDVKSAFLNGDLDVERFMRQLQGFVIKGKESYVCRLKKTLYGLKQAPRAWYLKISEYFISLGFDKCYSDYDLYVLKKDNLIIIIALFVDDLLVTGNNIEAIYECISKLKEEYEMTDLGLLHYYLGMQVYQHDDCTYVSQSKYIGDLLKRFDLEQCKACDIPMSSGIKFNINFKSQ